MSPRNFFLKQYQFNTKRKVTKALTTNYLSFRHFSLLHETSNCDSVSNGPSSNFSIHLSINSCIPYAVVVEPFLLHRSPLCHVLDRIVFIKKLKLNQLSGGVYLSFFRFKLNFPLECTYLSFGISEVFFVSCVSL